MKNRTPTFLLLIILSSNLFSQNLNTRVYSYSSHFYFESISLLPQGHFIWNESTEFLKLTVSGIYEIRSDTLILDSYPHKDKLLVRGSKEGNSLKITCYIKDETNDYMNYTLCAILPNNDTLIIHDQFKKTILPKGTMAFYLIDTKGLYSPSYVIKDSSINRIDVSFETKRVFDKETWKISDKEIIPKGFNGRFQNYVLTRQ
jgi:hypothetical protein